MKTERNEQTETRARLVGINHVALEVGDVEAALEFYGKIFDFQLRGRTENMAFIDMGDQFIAMEEGRTQKPDGDRHFGLVVDDRGKVRDRLNAMGVTPFPGKHLDFLDPWGNHIQIVEYEGIQFTKASNVLHGMGLDHLRKTPDAVQQLDRKGMSPAASSP
jgi:lactoylglutathione lyase